MLEELKLLVEMVSNLPALATWVVVGFGFYKLATWASVVGAITFVCKLAIERWAADRRHKREADLERARMPEVKILTADELVGVGLIHNARSALAAQMARVRQKRVGINSEFIHIQDVEWLKEAIDEKEDRDRLERLSNGNDAIK